MLYNITPIRLSSANRPTCYYHVSSYTVHTTGACVIVHAVVWNVDPVTRPKCIEGAEIRPRSIKFTGCRPGLPDCLVSVSVAYYAAWLDRSEQSASIASSPPRVAMRQWWEGPSWKLHSMRSYVTVHTSLSNTRREPSTTCSLRAEWAYTGHRMSMNPQRNDIRPNTCTPFCRDALPQLLRYVI